MYNIYYNIKVTSKDIYNQVNDGDYYNFGGIKVSKNTNSICVGAEDIDNLIFQLNKYKDIVGLELVEVKLMSAIN